ncbi:MAG: hypothetical protein M1113_02515 [Candidatus Thermoplasmatota archaeon]|nr:hypothetical protein [Candidatus Thermoplasmatota archaeon]
MKRIDPGFDGSSMNKEMKNSKMLCISKDIPSNPGKTGKNLLSIHLY